jgi:hypothetical protein
MGNSYRSRRLGALPLVLLLAGCPGHLEDPSLINGNPSDGGNGVPQVNVAPDAAVPSAPDASSPDAPAIAARPDAPLARPDANNPDAPVANNPDAPVTDARPSPASDAAVGDARGGEAGTAGPSDPGNVMACPMPDAVAAMILGQCAKCHSAQLLAGGLDLASPNVKARLINIPSKGCMGKPLVVANPAVGGVMFDKLAGPVPGCGGQMPFGGPYLGPMELKCLKDWIKPSP